MSATDRLTVQRLHDAFSEFYDPDPKVGIFNGYVDLGYIGNRQRNYLLDAWLVDAANERGWTLAEVVWWAGSTYARHTLDREPMTYTQFAGYVASDMVVVRNRMRA